MRFPLDSFARPLTTSLEYESVKDPAMREIIARRILLTNLRRLHMLLWGVVVFTGLVLACSHLLRERAIEDLGSVGPFHLQIAIRSLWLVVDLLAIFVLRRLLASSSERSVYLLGALETGTILVNMLFVVFMLDAGYSYNPSLEALYIALFALASVIRLSLTKSLVVIGLPCLLLLLAILGHGDAGVAHVSNIISLVAITILALIIFRLMFLAGVRELEQQMTIERQLAEMEHLAGTDSLTQLANRRRLYEHLEMEWRRAQRDLLPLAVIMVDVDYFKKYNDLYGHLAGDDCLQTIARVIGRHTQRGGDMGARYGGEEFVVLLPGTDLAGAAAVAENIRQGVLAMKRSHAGSPEGCVTVSLGVATNRSATLASATELLSLADQALYRAKASGRNRVALVERQAAEASL